MIALSTPSNVSEGVCRIEKELAHLFVVSVLCRNIERKHFGSPPVLSVSLTVVRHLGFAILDVSGALFLSLLSINSIKEVKKNIILS